MIVEVLYNPNAGRDGQTLLKKLHAWAADASLHYTDVTKEAYAQRLWALGAEDRAVVAGGDGTLNRFVNDVDVQALRCGVYYYPIGSGNDFAHDLGKERGCEPIDVKAMLSQLPTLYVNGTQRRFLNGAGVGLDGYVCKEGNEQHRRTGKPVNYLLVAIKGLLWGFKPVRAAVTVDGVRREYNKVWLAPTMHGRYFGGGMKIAPDQDRHSADGEVTSIVYFGRGKLYTMCIFPTIFKGTHVRFKKNVILIRGREVTVEFDRPCTMQVDGEIVDRVSAYTVKAYNP